MKKLFATISFCLILMALTLVLTAFRISANGTADSKPISNVLVDFDGLMALCMGNPSQVGTAILDVAHHTPELSIRQGDKTLYKLTGAAEIGSLTVSVEGGENKVSQYRPGLNNQFDWGHVLDLEGDVLQKEVHLRREAIAAKIYFTTGTFFGDKLSQDLLMLRSLDGTTERFKRRVAMPAAAIDLKSGQALTITGNDGRTAIRLPYSELGYQISIHNLPPVEMADMNHFLFYFAALDKADNVKPLEPVIVQRASFFPRPIACGAIGLSKSKISE